MNNMSVPEKLSVNKYDLDEGHSHIEIDNEICRKECKTKACLFVCPASVYTQTESGDIMADFAGCLECGTCKAACSPKALHWEYPRGGFGVIYRNG
jgi:ferredoxin like protein